MRILITRPQTDAESLATQLRARGHECTLAPMLTITPIVKHFHPPAHFAFTSSNGVRALLAQFDGNLPSTFTSIPVFAVGERTADEAHRAGFDRITTASGNVDALATQIKRARPKGTLIHICGIPHVGTLATRLKADAIDARTITLYQATATQVLAKNIADQLRQKRFDGVVFYSLRSTQIFIKLLDTTNIQTRPHAFCLTPTIAQCARKHSFQADAATANNDDAICTLIAQS